MNNNKTTTAAPTDNTQLIQKLCSEYEELHKKCCKLYAFRHSLDVDQKMNFDMDALVLMQRQLESMEAYRHILYLRIRHLGRLSIEIKTEHDPNFDEVDPEQKAQALHHCGQDTVNFEQLSEDITDAYKDYCRGVFEQFLSREISWAKFVEKVALPFCHENVNEFVNAIKDGRSNCRPGREKCQVGDGSAVVEKPVITGESLKQLMDYHVIGVCEPGFPCEGCVQDHYNTPCCKVELVGGYYLCLAPLPNSIVTE